MDSKGIVVRTIVVCAVLFAAPGCAGSSGNGGVAALAALLRNPSPVASAGVNRVADIGSAAALDGGGSSDPRGRTLSFEWRLLSAPSGSAAEIVDPAAEVTAITPDFSGTYEIELVVSAGGNESDPARVRIVAQNAAIVKEILIYYGWPSYINGSGGSVDAAVAHFRQYDYLVLGAGLEEETHGDHAATVDIISHADMASTAVFGYIDLGVSTNNYSLSEIRRSIALWRDMGVHGVFLDDYGYDYSVTRERQNEAVESAHEWGLPVVANSWVPDDAFSSDVHPTGNPEGLDTSLGSGDYYLYESFGINTGSYELSPDWHAKMTDLAAFRASLSFGILTVTTNEEAYTFDADEFGYAFHCALIYGDLVEAFGWGEYGFSGPDSLAPYRTRPDVHFTSFTGPLTYTPPGMSHLYERTTDAGSIVINGSDIYTYSAP